MGLIKEVRQLRKRREFEEMVQLVFGKSVKEINELLERRAIIQQVQEESSNEDIVGKNKEKAMNKMTPEQMVAMFAEDVEEFYPDGNAPQH